MEEGLLEGNILLLDKKRDLDIYGVIFFNFKGIQWKMGCFQTSKLYGSQSYPCCSVSHYPKTSVQVRNCNLIQCIACLL